MLPRLNTERVRWEYGGPEVVKRTLGRTIYY